MVRDHRKHRHVGASPNGESRRASSALERIGHMRKDGGLLSFVSVPCYSDTLLTGLEVYFRQLSLCVHWQNKEVRFVLSYVSKDNLKT